MAIHQPHTLTLNENLCPFAPTTISLPLPLTAQKHLCLPLRSHSKPDFDAFILFPDSQIERQQGVSVSAADVQSGETVPKDDRPFAVFFVLGCVDYRFEFESGHHQTGFVYELRKSELRNGLLYDRIYPSSNVIVPRSVLNLDSWPFGDGFYAD